MQIGDLVRTKQTHSAYGYGRPICIIVGTKSRIDGTYIEIIDQKGKVRNWWPEELEVLNENR
jgi:hypothetical protein